MTTPVHTEMLRRQELLSIRISGLARIGEMHLMTAFLHPTAEGSLQGYKDFLDIQRQIGELLTDEDVSK